jgi:hypothetical protein
MPEAPVGTVWGLPAERAVTAVRRDAEVKADRSVFFTSDRVAVRATCRVVFGFPHTTGLVPIRLAASWQDLGSGRLTPWWPDQRNGRGSPASADPAGVLC